MIRFHLDEHVHPAIAAGLRHRGIDVTTTTDAGLSGADDEDQLSFARSEGRVIVTHDDDFLALHGRGISHAGIAYCHQQSHTVRDLLRALLLLCECFSAEEIQRRVEFL
ncbi:MAG: DUF5615 family PIN-like protein [Planctomycetota bacterium]|jgi:uncharacterized protein with PIN domain